MGFKYDPFSLHVGLYGARVERATANLPQTAAGALFTVAGGLVAVHLLLGEVTTIIQTQANATKLTHTSDIGPTTRDLTATTDITGDIVGTYYSLDTAASDVLKASAGRIQATAIQDGPWVIDPGDINLDCAASNTGQVKWRLWYQALDTGATIVAV